MICTYFANVCRQSRICNEGPSLKKAIKWNRLDTTGATAEVTRVPEGDTALWGGFVVDKLPTLLKEERKLVLNSILL